MIKGTKTEQNLLKAFAGESQARNRYSMYASIAKKEGYERVAEIFLTTAANEFEHAKLFYNKLEGGNVEITATYPAGVKGTTLENLEYAANGENEEANILYPEFERIAKEEGFPDVAQLFKLISTIEAHHESRYKELHELLKSESFFKKNEIVEWECRECGYIHKGTTAPTICPVCAHAQGFYQLKIDLF